MIDRWMGRTREILSVVSVESVEELEDGVAQVSRSFADSGRHRVPRGCSGR